MVLRESRCIKGYLVWWFTLLTIFLSTLHTTIRPIRLFYEEYLKGTSRTDPGLEPAGFSLSSAELLSSVVNGGASLPSGRPDQPESWGVKAAHDSRRNASTGNFLRQPTQQNLFSQGLVLCDA